MYFATRRDLLAKVHSVRRVIVSSLPLTLLGAARLVTTKSSNYQEHVTEYGVHWNFFITLATVRVRMPCVCWKLKINDHLYRFCLLVHGEHLMLIVRLFYRLNLFIDC